VTDLRKYAQGKPCMVRLAGVCNGNPETTVLAHVRLIGISGMGLKAPDILGAWCCSSCHYMVDTANHYATQAAFAEGVYRTIAELVKAKVVKWSGK
jgi:hypothetical protein